MENRFLQRPARDPVKEQVPPVLAAIPEAILKPSQVKLQSFEREMAAVVSEMLIEAKVIWRDQRSGQKRAANVE